MGRTNDTKKRSEFTLAATGESLFRRPGSILKDNAKFMNLINLLRGADATFTNLENHFNSWSELNYPIDGYGTYGVASPSMVHEYKWCGFNLLARANNHAMDYGHNQILEETKILNEVELVHSGAGKNLAEATAPAYLETANGRVALISLTSTFVPGSHAGKQRKDMQGRPGVNPLRVDEKYMVPSVDFEKLKRIHTKLGFLKGIGKNELTFLGTKKFVLGDKHAIIQKAKKEDAERNIMAIKDARRAADYVFVSFHHHNEGIYYENEDLFSVPEEYVIDFSRECIDAGADAVIGHGPHMLQGIEIYKGKPIFYSLGHFFYDLDLSEKLPQELYDRTGVGPEGTPQDVIDACDAMRAANEGARSKGWYVRWFEALLALCTWNDGKLVELKLYPVASYNKSRVRRGRPMLADEHYGKKIIDYIASDCYSGRYGTKIDFKEGVGYVKL